jgi:hypothetical protein
LEMGWETVVQGEGGYALGLGVHVWRAGPGCRCGAWGGGGYCPP